MGLTAQILIGRMYLSTQFRRCMPRPARIVERATGDTNNIRIPTGDDGFRMFRVSD